MSRRALIPAVIALAVLVGLLAPARADHETSGMVPKISRSKYGDMAYWLFVPPGLPPNAPLFVHVHGGNNEAPDAAHRSGLIALAREFKFAAVFPQEQNGGIWDAPAAANEGRGSRAPAQIAQLTREVVAANHLDANRVFIGGISAGSGMASVTAAQYPELFAGVQDEAGSKYGAGKDVNTGPDGLDFEYTRSVERTGKDAADAMGKGARRIPYIRSTGTLDPFMSQPDQVGTVEHWLVARDWVDDGARNDSVSLTPTRSFSGVDGKPYNVKEWVDEKGCVFAQEWVITGLFHSYSGGQPTMVGDVTADPNAPDMRRIAVKFLLDQTDADGPPGCKAAVTPAVATQPSPPRARVASPELPATGNATTLRWGGIAAIVALGVARVRRTRDPNRAA